MTADALRYSNAVACTAPKNSDLVLIASANASAETNTGFETKVANLQSLFSNVVANSIRAVNVTANVASIITLSVSNTITVSNVECNSAINAASLTAVDATCSNSLTTNYFHGSNASVSNTFVLSFFKTATTSADTSDTAPHQIWMDDNYIYITTAAGDVKRVAVSTF
jgi:hypothetical protein